MVPLLRGSTVSHIEMRDVIRVVDVAAVVNGGVFYGLFPGATAQWSLESHGREAGLLWDRPPRCKGLSLALSCSSSVRSLSSMENNLITCWLWFCCIRPLLLFN